MNRLNEAPRSPLSLDLLEDRLALSASASGGVLYVYGTAGADRVSVAEVRTPLSVKLPITSLSGYSVNENGRTTFIAASPVSSRRVVFYGGAGDDTFSNSAGLTAEAHGGVGNDTLFGSSGGDSLFGDGGNDRLYGRGGGDFLAGGDDGDSLYGEDGADILFGGEGADYLDGGRDGATDYLWGGAGDDTFVRDVEPYASMWAGFPKLVVFYKDFDVNVDFQPGDRAG